MGVCAENTPFLTRTEMLGNEFITYSALFHFLSVQFQMDLQKSETYEHCFQGLLLKGFFLFTVAVIGWFGSHVYTRRLNNFEF